jgi:fructose-1,6-bisphosphatase/sedoheptulose 1,7-bisphosphatase-like protein
MYLRDGDAFRAIATHNAPPAYVEARSRDLLLRPSPDVPLGRVVITKQAVQIVDLEYSARSNLNSLRHLHSFLLRRHFSGFHEATPLTSSAERATGVT